MVAPGQTVNMGLRYKMRRLQTNPLFKTPPCRAPSDFHLHTYPSE